MKQSGWWLLMSMEQKSTPKLASENLKSLKFNYEINSMVKCFN